MGFNFELEEAACSHLCFNSQSKENKQPGQLNSLVVVDSRTATEKIGTVFCRLVSELFFVCGTRSRLTGAARREQEQQSDRSAC